MELKSGSHRLKLRSTTFLGIPIGRLQYDIEYYLDEKGIAHDYKLHLGDMRTVATRDDHYMHVMDLVVPEVGPAMWDKVVLRGLIKIARDCGLGVREYTKRKENMGDGPNRWVVFYKEL
jgi:hypothetical protein